MKVNWTILTRQTTCKMPVILYLKLFWRFIFLWWKMKWFILFYIFINEKVMHIFTKRFAWISSFFSNILIKHALAIDFSVKCKMQLTRQCDQNYSFGGFFFIWNNSKVIYWLWLLNHLYLIHWIPQCNSITLNAEW